MSGVKDLDELVESKISPGAPAVREKDWTTSTTTTTAGQSSAGQSNDQSRDRPALQFSASQYNELARSSRPQDQSSVEKKTRHVLSDSSRVVLVTGGAGFLGSHLCEYLAWQRLSHGEFAYQVHCIDNFHTGDISNLTHQCRVRFCNVLVGASPTNLGVESDAKVTESAHDGRQFPPVFSEKKSTQSLPRTLEEGSFPFPKQTSKTEWPLIFCWNINIIDLRVRDFVNQTQLSHVHEIYHLACPASPVHYQSDPVYTWKTNTFGTYHVMELARHYRARVLYTSTSEVYGEPLEHPQTETLWSHLNTFGPRSCYDVGKAAAENLIMEYATQHKLHASVVRLFNVYGPRMSPNDGRIVSNFITQILKGQRLTVYGDGSQTRSLCYVDDVIRGLYLVMHHPTPLQPINLGNPHELSVLDIASAIISIHYETTNFKKNRSLEKVNSSSLSSSVLSLSEISSLTPSSSSSSSSSLPCRLDHYVQYKPARIDDPSRRKPNIELAKTILNWEPTCALREGLLQTYDHFTAREYFEQENCVDVTRRPLSSGEEVEPTLK